MLIAADVGGTNTRIGLFTNTRPRPRAIAVREYPSHAFPAFGEVLARFAGDVEVGNIEAAAIGIAGPIVGRRARLTNVAWEIAADEVAAQLDVPRVRLLNDLEAMATSVEALRDDELDTVYAGSPSPDGNVVVLAAGTGLGEAYLPRIDGRFRVLASEAGHADFAARTDRECDLARELRTSYGRASVEHVLSGSGLLNLHRFTHAGGAPCPAVPDTTRPDAAARTSRAGLEQSCVRCVDALNMFVEALGAEAGNLGLRGTATGGVFIGGGIAPKILPALHSGAFVAAFLDKAPMQDLVARMPIRVILNTEAGLLGAARAAAALLQ